MKRIAVWSVVVIWTFTSIFIQGCATQKFAADKTASDFIEHFKGGGGKE